MPWDRIIFYRPTRSVFYQKVGNKFYLKPTKEPQLRRQKKYDFPKPLNDLFRIVKKLFFPYFFDLFSRRNLISESMNERTIVFLKTVYYKNYTVFESHKSHFFFLNEIFLIVSFLKINFQPQMAAVKFIRRNVRYDKVLSHMIRLGGTPKSGGNLLELQKKVG